MSGYNTGFTFGAAGGGLTLADAALNATYYPTFSSVATGSVSTEFTNLALTYNPSTGTLTNTLYVGTGTGDVISASSANAGASNVIKVTNTSNTASAGASFGAVAVGGGTLTMGANSGTFSASPTNFAEVSGMSIIAGSQGLTLWGSSLGGGTKIAYGSFGPTNAHVINGSGALVLGETPSAAGNAGTAGQVLTSQGPSSPPIWSAAGGLTLANSTTAATFYLPFAAVATGSVTTEYTNTNLTYNPSTFVLTSAGGDALINGVTVGKGKGYVATNTAVGPSALSSNTSGANNTAIGNSALLSATGASGNTAVGSTSMFSAVSAASNNTAVGFGALYLNTAGANNTAVGYQAAYSSTGGNTTAVGYKAGYSITTGYGTYVGYNAGTLATGTNNTAIGYTAAQALTSGTNNTVLGHLAFGAGTIGAYNVAVGSSAMSAGVVTGTYNIGLGVNAANAVTSGNENIAIGHSALAVQTTGSNNVAIGQSALSTATTIGGAVAIGAFSFQTTTAGTNVGLGYQTGKTVTSGIQNVAIGYGVMQAATTGSLNTAVGYNAMSVGVTTGNNNTAVGGSALTNVAGGNDNTAIGKSALSAVTVGSTNTAVGSSAGSTITTGSYNTIVGSYNGSAAPISATGSNWVVLADGQSNIPICANGTTGTTYLNTTGLPAGVSTGGVLIALSAGDFATFKSTANGANGFNLWQTGTNTNNMIVFYKGATQSPVGTVSCTTTATAYNTTSDYRIKENVVSMEDGLSRVMALRPVAFDFNNPETEVAESDVHSEGFLAHEVQEVFPYAVTGEKDAVNEDGTIKLQSVDYGRITPLLVKAIQEQQAIIEALTARLEKAGL